MSSPKPDPRPPLEPGLPGRYYRDPGVLEREWDLVFARAWLYAGRADSIPDPGDRFTLQVGAESVIVVRDAERRLRAFYNVCRHRGSRLCADGRGRFAGSIRCPYHAWTYALDGALLGAPRLGGDGFPKEELSLHPAGVEAWAGFVFVRLDGGGEALAGQLGGIPERSRRYPLAGLRPERRMEHEVEANWKILVENFMECYHCPGVHPELCDLVPLYGRGQVDSPDTEPAYYREGVSTSTLTGTTRRPLFSGLGEEERRKYNAEILLPNTFLYLFPDYACTRTLWPLRPTRTRIVSEWLFEAAILQRDDFDSSDAVEFLNRVGAQDWAVCEGVQRGVASRAFRGGVYVPQERDAAGVARWFLERLEGAGGAR